MLFRSLQTILEEWLRREEILIERHRKKGRKKILVTEDIMGLMEEVEIKSLSNREVVLKGKLKIGESGTLRPRDFINAFIMDNSLKADIDSINFKRISQII